MKKIKSTKKDFLEYVEKKSGSNCAKYFQEFIENVTFILSETNLKIAYDTFIQNMKSIKTNDIDNEKKKLLVRTGGVKFKVYFHTNNHKKSFLVIDYYRKNEYYYFYQNLPKNISIAQFE